MIHVAIVTFGYPPIPHVCGTRGSMMASELVALGHEVTVVTVDWRPESTDEPDTENPRVLRVDPRSWHPAFRVDRAPFTTESDPAGRSRLRTLRRMFAWGPYENWARAALSRLLEVHARHPVDVVWAIHGDDSSHEIAFRFHRGTGVPWVADFKDPWNLFHKRPAWALQWLATWRRVRTSSGLTETARVQAERDVRFGRPTDVIWSGYDAELMAAAPSRRSGSAFSLVYTGNVQPPLHDEDAIARMLQYWNETHGARAPIELHFYGTNCQALERALERRGVAEFVRFHPFVARRDVFGLLKGADALVMLPMTNWSPSGGSVGVKELEYFASGTPVVCLGPLLDEIRTAAGPQVCEALDAMTAVLFIDAEMDAFRTGAPSPRRREVNAPIVLRHAWPSKARDLERVLEAASQRSAARRAGSRRAAS
jgi:glycosyltransferase involved in cell wall biosynthesis